MLSRRRGAPARAEPGRPARGVRPGAERRVLRDLPLGHDAQGPGRRRTSSSATRFSEDGHEGAHVRLPARQPAVRRGVEEGRGRRSRTRHETLGLRRPLRRRPAADQRRLVPVPAAHDLEDEAGRGGRLAARHRLQRLAAVHRRRRSGECEIRRWIIENDWLEAIVALPDQLFYNTGISTYFWIAHQPQAARARGQGAARRRPRALSRRCARASARSARRSAPTQIDEITRLYGDVSTETTNARSRSSATSASASSGSPSSARCGCASRSPRTTLGGAGGAPSSVAKLERTRRSSSTALRPLTRLDVVRRSREALDRATRTRSSSAGVHLAVARRRSPKAIGRRSAYADPEGEVQTGQGRPAPDPDLRGLRERPARRGRRRVPRARGAAVRPRRLDRPRRRRRSATRSRSPATSTCTSRRGRWRRSTPRCEQLEEEIQRAARGGDGMRADSLHLEESRTTG